MCGQVRIGFKSIFVYKINHLTRTSNPFIFALQSCTQQTPRATLAHLDLQWLQFYILTFYFICNVLERIRINEYYAYIYNSNTNNANTGKYAQSIITTKFMDVVAAPPIEVQKYEGMHRECLKSQDS